MVLYCLSPEVLNNNHTARQTWVELGFEKKKCLNIKETYFTNEITKQWHQLKLRVRDLHFFCILSESLNSSVSTDGRMSLHMLMYKTVEEFNTVIH